MNINLIEKSVFLFGAGLSVGADCKTSNEMLEDLVLAPSNLVDTTYEDYFPLFKQVKSLILASLDYQIRIKNTFLEKEHYKVNIEDFILVLRKLIFKDELIPKPLVGNWSDDILKLEIRKEDVFEKFLEYIENRLKKDWLKFEPIKAEKMLLPLKLFLEELPPDSEVKLNMFTLNYDLIFEYIFNKGSETILKTGFTKSGWNEANLNDDSGGNRIVYLKLHGSLNWEKKQGKLICDSSHNPVDKPVLIFGESNKMFSFDPFFSNLVMFKQQLQKANLFIIVGYSFHDVYINNILLQKVNEGFKQLLIVDPFAYGEKNTSTDADRKAKFLDKLRIVQTTKGMSALENITVISEDRFKIVPLTASDFFQEYFKDNASKLVKLIYEIDEGEKPF